MVEILTMKNFDKTLKDSDVLVLVDFYADWCGPCKMMGPVLEELAKEMAKQVKIVKVNVDSENELASRYGIRSIPTLVVYNKGEEVDRMMGYMPKSALKDQISKILP